MMHGQKNIKLLGITSG